MTRVERILMRRDGLTRGEAADLVADTRGMIADRGYSPWEVESILYEELGLEPDYIFDLI